VNGKELIGMLMNVFSLGGTPDSQREFLETLSSDPSSENLPSERRKGNVPPITNQFALGYTYQDVLDADQEGAPYSHSSVWRYHVLSEDML
jgi:hypothetical protein